MVRPMIEFTSLVDKIAGDLQSQIAAGKLKPGERVPPERSLCVSFGVGRTTVREALKSLAVRGLISRRGRSVIVNGPERAAPPSVDLAGLAVQVNIKQLYEVRKLIEVRIAGWAAQRATEEDLLILRRSIEPVRPEVKVGSPNRSFHDALAHAVHNPALAQVYDSGSNLFFRLPFFWQMFDDAAVKSLRAWRHETAHRWHEQILRAIEDHDVAEAEGAMFQHLDIMEKDLLNRLPASQGSVTIRNRYPHPMLREMHKKKSALPGKGLFIRTKSLTGKTR
jgi:GntR family transcriptional repressor for pyruvate dehydrogenase complex